ncbi:MAG TPA: ABC transporter ATP-binding protein [Bacillota bacterium]|nr:ABC transporter ATP-binding protein [Bacillota bacterium]
MSQNAILVQNLSFSYSATEPVLTNVTLSIASGSFTGILGPNGAGKSTLLKLLSRWYKPDSGEIRISGESTKTMNHRELARRIAVVEHEQRFATDITVRELVALGRLPYQSLLSEESEADRKAVELALTRGGLQELSERALSTLSGGERQRARLAMALAQDASILALDEPTTHLDIKHQLELLTLLETLKARGLTVLAVLHDLNLAALFCEELVLLREGQVYATGTVRQVLTAENIAAVYDCRATVYQHPIHGVPQVALLR